MFATGFLILYAFRAVHIVTQKWSKLPRRITRVLFLVLTFFVYISTTYVSVNFETYRDNQALIDYTIVGAITLSVTVLSICIIQLISDILLLFRYLRFRYKNREVVSGGNEMTRRTFVSQMALAVGGVMLGSFLWGTTKGKFGWRIMKNKLAFDNLPKAFDGMKIVQISDLHLGSFNNDFEPLEEAIEMINELEADYIFFTGDLVNETYKEAEPWVEVIKKLKAKKGKYSILGNHDYGWGRIPEEEKATNSKNVARINEEMGFKILLNQHEILEHQGQKIGLIGVENWGYSPEGWFPTKGDYNKSVENMEEVPFKILLSHDPTHWDHKIIGKENDVDLTLAGHTHGGQMGISIPGLFELSAAKLFYNRYAGAYQEKKQHLYVNRGLGFLIFPGRVGMPPEITLHVLNKA
jgi:predicted MPP superfamily phosphohydrolase